MTPTLHRTLTSAQLSMIAIGGAIGTGLFLGSGFAIQLAGPAVLVSYAVAGLLALALAACLAELTVHDPLPGGFGAQAERWLGPWAGSVTRWSYWSCVVLAVGTEVTAVAIYMAWWLPAVPGLVWIAGFSAALVALNCLDVRWFGAVEYGFSALKIVAILLFIGLGVAVIVRSGVGLRHWTDTGFAPHGAWGIWSAVIVAIFSYLSIEMIAIAAGEAAEPRVAVVRAFRATLARLVLFYGGSLGVTLAIVPWAQAGTAQSPFVTVAAATGLPHAAGLLNAVVLVAALSAMNSQLYAAGRMLWSLAEAGEAPRGLGALTPRGAPARAVLLSSGGAGLAAALSVFAPARALGAMVALSMAGALTAWGMIFATHHAFRRRHGPPAGFRVPGGRWLGVAGVAAIAAVLLGTPFQPAFRWTLAWGIPFVAIVTLLHQQRLRRPQRHDY